MSASAGDTVTVTTADGTVLTEYPVTKDTANVVVSSSDVTTGETYTVTTPADSTTAVAGEWSGGGMAARPGSRPDTQDGTTTQDSTTES